MSERCDLSDLPVDQCACRIHAPQPRVRDSWRTGEYSITARLPARFNSECDSCGEAVSEGDPIARTDNNEYICGECAS